MKWAKEQTTAKRVTYVQATRILGAASQIRLAALRDLVAATADYDERSEVLLEQSSVKVIEVKRSHWRDRGRDEPTNLENGSQ